MNFIELRGVIIKDKYFASAPYQEYTKKFLKQIREEDLVIYDGKACHAVRILPRKDENPLFEILGEDDGYLFSYDHPIKFDLHWTDGLIKQLEDAKKYWNKIKDTYKYN